MHPFKSSDRIIKSLSLSHSLYLCILSEPQIPPPSHPVLFAQHKFFQHNGKGSGAGGGSAGESSFGFEWYSYLKGQGSSQAGRAANPFCQLLCKNNQINNCEMWTTKKEVGRRAEGVGNEAL